jgi:muramoyltetrapeptide carboxypeptidase
MKHKPPRLKSGDRVCVIAPASPVRKELFERGVAVLREFGFEVISGDAFRKWRYLAGDDEYRAGEFLRALEDPNIRAIFFARGGYGSVRLLPSILKSKLAAAPKVLFGCSDVSTLHQYFQRIHDWTVFHGPMPSGDMARGQLHADSFQLALLQSEPYTLAPAQVEILQHGEAQGMLTGGCLTLLDACIGTAWEPDWRDTILFLEDVSTKPYQIDRMLTHLKLAGKLEGVRGFIFGEMKDCVQVENQDYTLQEVILDILGPLQKPICFNFPSGHVRVLNWTLPLGIHAGLKADLEFQLEILESAVQ